MFTTVRGSHADAPSFPMRIGKHSVGSTVQNLPDMIIDRLKGGAQDKNIVVWQSDRIIARLLILLSNSLSLTLPWIGCLLDCHTLSALFFSLFVLVATFLHDDARILRCLGFPCQAWFPYVNIISQKKINIFSPCLFCHGWVYGQWENNVTLVWLSLS